MSAANYPVGLVANATVRGIEDVRVMRYGPKDSGWFTPEYVGDLVGNEPQWRTHRDSDVTDVRPLVVLDLAKVCTGGHGDAVSYCVEKHTVDNCDLVKRVAEQIREQTKPPRPAEPIGLGAVVEDAHGNNWIRFGAGPAAWVLAFASPSNRDSVAYATLDVVAVLSEGVTP